MQRMATTGTGGSADPFHARSLPMEFSVLVRTTHPSESQRCRATDAEARFSLEKSTRQRSPCPGTAMCGRYAAFLPAEAVAGLFRTVNLLPNVAPSWNKVPTQSEMVVRRHHETSDPRAAGLVEMAERDGRGSGYAAGSGAGWHAAVLAGQSDGQRSPEQLGSLVGIGGGYRAVADAAGGRVIKTKPTRSKCFICRPAVIRVIMLSLEAFLQYVIMIARWEWSFSFGASLREAQSKSYHDYRHLTIFGSLVSPKLTTTDVRECELTLMPDRSLDEDRWGVGIVTAVGSLSLNRGTGVLQVVLPIPAGVLAPLLATLVAGRLKYATLTGERLRRGKAIIQSMRFDTTFDEA